MKKMCNFYEVYEGDELVAKGFKSDVAYLLDITESGVDSVCRNKFKAKGKYLIKCVGKKEKVYSRLGDPIVSRPKKETFVERYWDLDRYGFTEMSESEYRRHQQLIEDKGYKAKYIKIPVGKRRCVYRVEVTHELQGVL